MIFSYKFKGWLPLVSEMTKQSRQDEKTRTKDVKKVKKSSSQASGREMAKTASKEIDELFSKKSIAKIPSQEVKTVKPVDEEFADTRNKKSKRPLTDDGLPIYSDKDMRIGTGGDTAECPFDCDCCF
jgi:tyrosyl-tRNA synthetase